MQLSPDAPVRSYDEVGAGDFVKVNGGWKRIAVEPETEARSPNEWKFTTEDSREYDGWHVLRYAKSGDFT